MVESARKLIQGSGQVWETIKKSDPKQLVLGLLGLGPLPPKVDAEARKMGHSAGSAIIASLESPWQKDKGEPEAPRDWLKSPLAAFESKASELEKRWIGEVPWAKVGVSVGYAVGFAVIQVILFVFTTGIGNAIEQAAVGLGRLAGQLGKAVGAAAEFLAEIGRGVDEVGSLIEKVLGAALKPLENLLKPVLAPLTEMLEGLRTLLRKLLGVAGKEEPALERAAAKALGEAEKHVPVPHAPAAHPAEAHPPPGQPPAAHLPTADVPAAHPPAAPKPHEPAPPPAATKPHEPAPPPTAPKPAEPVKPAEPIKPGEAPKAEAPKETALLAASRESEQGLRFELTEKRAERLKRVAEAINDETKWGNVLATDRLRLGRVYDELLANLLRAGMGKVQKVEHYVAVDAKLIARLRAGGGRVLITEGRLAGGMRRFDLLEIDFNKGTAELIDLASGQSPATSKSY